MFLASYDARNLVYVVKRDFMEYGSSCKIKTKTGKQPKQPVAEDCCLHTLTSSSRGFVCTVLTITICPQEHLFCRDFKCKLATGTLFDLHKDCSMFLVLQLQIRESCTSRNFSQLMVCVHRRGDHWVPSVLQIA